VSQSPTAAPLQAPPPLGDRLQAFLAAHPFYGYRDLVADVFAGDLDACIDAYCAGLLPPAVRVALEESMSPEWLQVLLLRRLSRQLSALLAALQ
jgi:hypothetical protein